MTRTPFSMWGRQLPRLRNAVLLLLGFPFLSSLPKGHPSVSSRILRCYGSSTRRAARMQRLEGDRGRVGLSPHFHFTVLLPLRREIHPLGVEAPLICPFQFSRGKIIAPST